MSASTEPDWTQVRRIRDDTGSHIEPGLNPDWPELWKLRWQAAVVQATTGVHIAIHQSASTPRWFGLSYYVGALSKFLSVSLDCHQMWSHLNGIESGYEMARYKAADGWPSNVVAAAKAMYARLRIGDPELTQDWAELDVDTRDHYCIAAENALRSAVQGRGW
ncbi:hypothetical protein [Nocardia sp. NPDC057227]|uniref:hypothetical protein n=1 Tax=Nocardia sp. NPDC057227 TaxID=3346056 RepID=UPI00362C201D